ncbi:MULTISPECIES: hypothetical protein [unclassified Bradyrhizobium]|uniref:hypothetical protein n=1 Tax=unclassified Bradyrhizobium TaxID=2631580 RepID=UPI001FF7B70F|nr:MULTISPECIES: hypothetical protein [unclassified Bradyrhizobium]MCK1269278.1 hypothetical protein [Bradyrhizobium sp. 84]MCK1374984.1 hypothetical protein [Bradyrhizobium sp. 49]MCK1417860.1 hypothetical protein [Bradyrhizobium sp. CW4]MCK1426345.1 hypothetical protein [Bradyrhizobium sp. 87]
MPSFSLTVPLHDIVARIIGDERFKSEALVEILSRMHATEQHIMHPEFLRMEAVITFRIAEVAMPRAGSDAADLAMEAGKNKVRSALCMAPTDAFLWLMLYSVELERNGLEARTTRFLDQSYAAGPLEGWISLRRNKLALSAFARLDEAVQIQVMAEFAHMVDSNFTEVAALNLMGVGWARREQLLRSLTDVDTIPREAFAKILLREGLKVNVPGVEIDERPWH